MEKMKRQEELAENRILCQDPEVNSSVKLHLSVNSKHQLIYCQCLLFSDPPNRTGASSLKYAVIKS